MQKFSRLSRKDISVVLQNYGINEFSLLYEFSSGIENVNIKLKVKNDYLVLRRWNNTNRKNIEFECHLIKELYKKNFPVPKLYKTLDKKEVVFFKGRYFGLFEYLPGKIVGSNKLNKRQLHSLGKKLAEIQVALKNVKPKGESNEKDLLNFEYDYNKVKIFKLLQKQQAVFQKIENEVKKLELEISPLKKSVRTGPTHNDFYSQNIKFNDNKITAILDFSDACIGAWVSDLATTLYDTTCEKNLINISAMKTILDGYKQKIKPTQTEKSLLPKLMRHRAIRIMLFYVQHQKNLEVLTKQMKKEWQILETLKNNEKQVQKILKK